MEQAPPTLATVFAILLGGVVLGALIVIAIHAYFAWVERKRKGGH